MASVCHIPRPCAVSTQALTPTEAGWHCARCRTEVVDFTRLPEAEVLAYLAARAGQRVCAQVAVPLVAWRHPRRPRGPRRWLLMLAALLGWPALGRAAGLPPRQLPRLLLQAAKPVPITVRGTVLDDSLNVPVSGAYVFVAGTRYGAVTNERGEFSFSFAPDWEPARTGELRLEVSAGHFTFELQTVAVRVAGSQPVPPLTVRLASVPNRGFRKGKALLQKPPVAPPEAR